jgi:hypothetical protein
MSSLLMSYLLATLGISPADAWAGFRGDGTSTTYATRLPLTWSSEENVAWRVALPGYGQSTPVFSDRYLVISANDRIYFFGKDGVTTVLQAGPKYKKLATNRLWSDAELQARKEEARKRPENRIPVSFDGSPPGGKGPTPPATLSPAQREAMIAEAVGDVVYGVAAVDGAFYVRTGTELICIRARE